jgi:hypothetical protein
MIALVSCIVTSYYITEPDKTCGKRHGLNTIEINKKKKRMKTYVCQKRNSSLFVLKSGNSNRCLIVEKGTRSVATHLDLSIFYADVIVRGRLLLC